MVPVPSPADIHECCLCHDWQATAGARRIRLPTCSFSLVPCACGHLLTRQTCLRADLCRGVFSSDRSAGSQESHGHVGSHEQESGSGDGAEPGAPGPRAHGTSSPRQPSETRTECRQITSEIPSPRPCMRAMKCHTCTHLQSLLQPETVSAEITRKAATPCAVREPDASA